MDIVLWLKGSRPSLFKTFVELKRRGLVYAAWAYENDGRRVDLRFLEHPMWHRHEYNGSQEADPRLIEQPWLSEARCAMCGRVNDHLINVEGAFLCERCLLELKGRQGSRDCYRCEALHRET